MFDNVEYQAECPFCKSTMQPVKKLTEGIYIYKCDQLYINQEISVIASFDFIKTFFKKGKGELTDKERGIMLHLILKFAGNVVFDIAKSGDYKIGKHMYRFVKYEQLKNMYPKTNTDRIKMILENLSRVYLNMVGKKVIGKRQSALTANVNKYIFLPNGSSQPNIQHEIINALEEGGYISKKEENGAIQMYQLTEKTYDQIGLESE